ncbi:unnamed protein product [Calicophoron daubneyi]|uniref:WD repeat and FYVE domain-containing protein 3 n=1 Tax=Calicophoron daubneyi TaxID=300641 RepID=A0AAV2TVY4_CALDB
MHFMRRCAGNQGDRELSSAASSESSSLGRLFDQYKQIQDAQEQDQMFYELLPLFFGVLSSCQPVHFVDKFPDVHAFCARASQLLVREVKCRAANQTSEEGSRQISLYLEPSFEPPKQLSNSSHDQPPLNVENRGWNLLSCLNLLSSGHTSLIECMVAASLPSTLVKCLYIFLDLPQHSASSNKLCAFHPTFKQLVQRLCLYPVVAEELARKDALCHLFSASTDWCPVQNVIWRSTTASVLSTIAQNGLTLPVVKYIHESKCISECLKNISQGRLVPLEILDSFIALLHVLRESSLISQVLMDEFRLKNGYLIATEFILKFEQNSSSTENKMALQTVVSLIARLVTCGSIEIRPKPGAGEQIHVIPGFAVPMPKSGARKSVRNVHAFDVLQSLFLSSCTSYLSLTLLDAIQSIYLQDLSNYFILEQQNTLVVFAKKIFHKPVEVQEAFFNLMEVLVTELHYVPMREISSIVVLLKTCGFTSCLVVTLRHLVHLLHEYHVFRDVYHDVGLLELVVELLHHFAESVNSHGKPASNTNDGRAAIRSTPSAETPVLIEIGQLLLDFLRFCVTSNVPNADLCQRLGATDCLLNRLLPCQSLPNAFKWRKSALTILEELMLTSGGEELMPLLLIKMHTAFVELKIEILRSFCRVLRESHRCRAIFRKVNGFVYVVQELVYLEGCLNTTKESSCATVPNKSSRRPPVLSATNSIPLQNSDQSENYYASRAEFLSHLTYKQIFSLVKTIFMTLGIAMKFEPANSYYFGTEIQYSNVTTAVIGLGSFDFPKPSGSTAESAEYHDSPDIEIPGYNVFHTLFSNIRDTEIVLVSSTEQNSPSPGQTLSKTLTFLCSIFKPDEGAQKPSEGEPTLIRHHIPRCLVECCVLARYFYDLAVDAYDKQSLEPGDLDGSTSAKDGHAVVLANQSATPQSEKLHQPNESDPTKSCSTTSIPIVHPGAIISMLHLTALLNQPSNDRKTSPSSVLAQSILKLQNCLLDVITDLFQSERNQQLLCSVSMPREILQLFRDQLADEEAPLHSRIQALFECLVIQCLTPNDLREFLRITNPLCCASSDLIESQAGWDQDPMVEITYALQNARDRYGGHVPLSQVKCLIATVTPATARLVRPFPNLSASSVNSSTPDSSVGFSIMPPFVEFDMNPEGFGCLFLPSVAPQGPASVANLAGATHSTDITCTTGGVGSGERIFPPPHGFTFSSWLCVLHFDRVHRQTSHDRDSLAGGKSQPQAVHLLTIVRGIQSVNDQLICLRVFIHPRTRMLVVSTQERLAHSDRVTDTDVECDLLTDTSAGPRTPNTTIEPNVTEAVTAGCCAVFPCGLPGSENSQEWPIGIWRHLALVFSRAGMIKASSCSLYLDGRLVGVQRLSYIGASAASSGFLGRQTMPSSVSAFVGTPASMRRPSCLVWRQGPLHLIEEPLDANRIAYITRLGPNYVGSFQSPPPVSLRSPNKAEEAFRPLFPEEKLILGIYASATSTLTLSRIRKVYNVVDAKAIARQFYISPKENATPIRLLHNSGAHLCGPARPLGAVLVGYQGVRAFSAIPVVRQLHCVGGGAGGVRIGLALVAMAQDVETLYAATKTTCTLIKCSSLAASEMLTSRGYQMLAMLLRKKRHLLTTRILDSILSLTLNMDSWIDANDVIEVDTPLDHPAFSDLVCDLDLWRVEREIPKESEVNHQSSAKALESPPPSPIETDYRLVANLINHLTELISVPTSTESTGARPPGLHPIWNLVFDRVLYLLMNAFPNGPRTLNPNRYSNVSIGQASLLDAVITFLRTCLSRWNLPKWLLRIGQLMAWTLPASEVNELEISATQLSTCMESSSASDTSEMQVHLIVLRNRLFQLLLSLITDSTANNRRLCNELLAALGFDWFHLFLRPSTHSSTVVLDLHLLILVLLNPSYSVSASTPVEDWCSVSALNLHRRAPRPQSVIESSSAQDLKNSQDLGLADLDGIASYNLGCPAGRWLNGCESLLKRRHGLLLDNSTKQAKRSQSRFGLAVSEFRLASCQQPGFITLQHLLSYHVHIPELFYLLSALFLKIPIREVPENFLLEFDCLHQLTVRKRESMVFESPKSVSESSPSHPNSATRTPPAPPTTSSSGVSGLVNNFLSAGGFTRRRARVVTDGTVDSSGVTSLDAVTTALGVRNRISICAEAATLLLHLLRTMLTEDTQLGFSPSESNVQSPRKKEGWADEYSEVMLRFMIFLYQSKPEFQPVAMSADFINGLVGVLNSAINSADFSASSANQSAYIEDPGLPSVRSVAKLSMEFLKIIIADNFTLPPPPRQSTHIVDILLEAWSDNCATKQHQELETYILCNLMEHFMATDVLTDHSLCVPEGGDVTNIPANLVYFAARIVDKMWQGYFAGDVNKVVDFLMYLTEHWSERHMRTMSSPNSGRESNSYNLNSIYRSLNRAVLYQLSRPILTHSDQTQVLELFSQIQVADEPPVSADLPVSNAKNGFSPAGPLANKEQNRSRSVLFSAANEDPEMPACLVHLLMQLVGADRQSKVPTTGPYAVRRCPAIHEHNDALCSEDKAPDEKVPPEQESNVNYYFTTFGLDELGAGDDGSLVRQRKQSPRSKPVENPFSPSEDMGRPTDEHNTSDQQETSVESFNLIVQNALSLWAECYLSRKSILALLAPESPLVSGISVPSLTDWIPVLESPCLLAWAQYVENEAAGLGGIGSETSWGRIPGPPSAEVRAPTQEPLNSAAVTSAVPPNTAVSGLHHQLSMRLSRIPGNVFRSFSSTVSASSADIFVNQATNSSSVVSSYPPSSATPNADISLQKLLTLPIIPSQQNILESIREAVHKLMPMQVGFLRELLEQQKRQYERNMGFIQRQLEVEWDKVEQELTRERGLWGRTSSDPLAKWKLDPTEGPCRMRKRMIPNLSFYSRYPYNPFALARSPVGNKTVSSSPTRTGSITFRCRQPRSRDSRLYFLNYQPRSILHEDWGPLAPWIMISQQKDRLQSTSSPLAISNEGKADISLVSPNLIGTEDSVLLSADGPESGTALSQSLNPEEIEESLQKTASLLRSSRRTSSYAATPTATDDLDEIITNVLDNEVPAATINHDKSPEDVESREQSLDSSEPSPNIDSVPGTPALQTVPDTTETSPPATVPSYSSAVMEDDEQLANHEAILRLLEPGERLSLMYRCARVYGLDVHEGLLLFGRAHFYVIDGYTLINTREIVDIDSLPPDVLHEPIVPCTTAACGETTLNDPRATGVRANTAATDLWSTGAVSETLGKQYFKFPYENIRGVHKRRYLLQPIALEVFNADGRNFLLVFSKGLQSKVYQRFQDVAPSTGNQNSQSLLSQKTSHGLLSGLLGEKTVTQRWERGELNNFQYLIYLNTLAGRSYNDLMQYPVFPWVISDYESEELDLSRPETFRDLSKPMGAQSPRRLSQFQRRYREWDDPTGETPPYHYGTHYSSAMIVASYLVRMEPFTQQFLKLQGGHFDLPDRMFYSVRDAWLSSSEHNMADVRELIPEFFYLPDFLVNSNRFDLGVRQNGIEVDDVILPPWAKSDPREFIRVHREALESEYVSAHLHEWIDLIFGYKQQGDAAVHACNVFHHLFYEGNVDIYSIDDPLRRSAVIGFINNFGQIPKQLFRKPHPCRRLATPRSLPLCLTGSPREQSSRSQLALDLFYRNLDCLKPHLQPLRELKHAVGQIVQLDLHVIPNSSTSSGGGGGAGGAGGSSAGVNPVSVGSVRGGNFNELGSPVNQNSSGHSQSSTSVASLLSGGPVLAVEQNKCLLPPNYTSYVAWGFTDGSLRIGSPLDQSERARCVFEMVDQGEILCCTAPDERVLITAGLSTVVRVWSVNPSSANSERADQTSTANSGVGTVDNSQTSNSANTVPQTFSGLRLRANLCGHTEAVTCLAASSAFNLVVSGSRDRTCILWDLTRLCFLRQLSGHTAPVAAVCISEATGDIATCAGTYLHLWNVNGEPIASVDTLVGRNKQILCVCMSTMYDWDAENVLITGGSDGVVRMWSLGYVRQVNPENVPRHCRPKSPSPVKNDPESTFDDGAGRVSGDASASSITKEEVSSMSLPSVNPRGTFESPQTSSKNGVKNSEKARVLSGWACQLLFRGKLTMHTAFGRSDNQQPAAITALAISRDHRAVLVGDARGRVHAWSVPSEGARGGMTDQWVRDEGATNCAAEECGVRFSLTERRHHCRNCGKVFCSKCSRFESEIYRLRLFKPVRVCQACFTHLRMIQAPKVRRARDSEDSSSPRTNTKSVSPHL